MAVDQRIRTTITTGRSGDGQFDNGPAMVVLMGCLAVAMCFTTFGMGLLNVASESAAVQKALADKALSKPPVLEPVPVAAPVAEPDKALESELRRLEQKKSSLAIQGETLTAELSRKAVEISAVKTVSEARGKTITDLRDQSGQISAGVAALRTKLASTSADMRRALEIQSQLERQLAALKDQSAQASLRIQELRDAIAEKRNTFDPAVTARMGPGREAAWVECVKGAVVLIPSKESFAVQDLVAHPDRFSQAVKNKHVGFLIRPEGFNSFSAARQVAERSGVKSIGYEPVDADWRIRVR